ncbi:MAG: Uma2 family endonuclease [Planctomycetes bacterium]|nr:Uma2 family endonuclease [Planctomycetota bacterium]MCH9727405.1 Uma2 family endonuclease [Planctomycetota bacterium]MCH9775910.1 Uma2 family endonuclease [Planctomycetota bacterium]MCH9792589.1 Uma2 family endonuclease [Planctomycetota bacterium]MDF1744681.1 Uma2 family endonuclease [Gimesia sp.]
MTESPIYTAEQLLETRLEQPEDGRWMELDRGKIINLDPPDIEHGTIVLNLSKMLSVYLHQVDHGYACFELGLLLNRNPDTVRFPAVSIFQTGTRFEETDKAITERKPTAIIEVASTNPRRQVMNDHVSEYVNWGVELIWVIDPKAKAVLEYLPARGSEVIDFKGKITGGTVMPDFVMKVEDLFTEPVWW